MATSRFLLRSAKLVHGSLLFVAVVISFVFGASKANAQWTQVTQFDNMTQGQGSVIYFLNGKTGFVGFENNSGTPSIWKSTDSGTTWVSATTPNIGFNDNDYVNDIWFAAPNDGWAVVGDQFFGRLWHTTDTGTTWVQNPNFNLSDPSSVRSTSKNLCIAGESFGVAISTDSGATFINPNPLNASVRGLDYVDDQHIVCTPYLSPNYYYSPNGGSTWLPCALNSGDAWGVWGMKGSSTFYVAPENSADRGEPSTVYRSDDYGASWKSISSLPFKTTGDIKGTGCAIFIQNCGQAQAQSQSGIYRSTDEGVSWINIGGPGPSGPNNEVDTRFAFTNNGSTIFAFDNIGGLWKTTDGGTGFTETGAGTLALDTAPIDLGIITNCQALDTTIVIYYSNNAMCALDTVNSWSMSIGGTGFNVSGAGQAPPIILAPGQTDSLQVTYTAGVGYLYDTVVITGNAANGPVWHIPVEVNIIPADSVEFTVAVSPDPIKPGDTLTVTVTPSLAVQGKGLMSIGGTLEYHSDSYNFLSATGGVGTAPLQYNANGPVIAGETAQLPFTISSTTDLPLDPATPILTLYVQAMVSDTTASLFALDSLLLNGSDPAYGNCVLSSSSDAAVSHLSLACGDTLLLLTMQNRLAFDAENPQPDPVTSENGYQSLLTLHASSDGIANVRITDMLGRMVSTNELAFSAGESASYTLDLADQPAGAYFYTILFSSMNGEVVKNGTVMVLR